jgi:PIN domain nuclease of toxin-antitoxin system
MSRVVLDASVILAVLGQEPGADFVLRILGDTAVSTVNLAEVQGKLVSRGVPAADAWEGARSLAAEVVDFDSEQARLVGTLLPQTQALGLSLGDRACLALGMVLKAPVYTTDQAWKSLKLGIKIHVVR